MVIGPRRQAGLVVGGVVLAAIALVTWFLGIEWGLIALSGLVVPAVLALGLVYVNVRRLERAVAQMQTETVDVDKIRNQVQLLTADRAPVMEQLRAMSDAVRELAETVDSRLATTERAHRMSRSDSVWLLAEQRRGEQDDAFSLDREGETELIRSSGLFDAEWYRAWSGADPADPVRHYVDNAAVVRVDPHALFASAWYLEQHPRALMHWRTPLGHFIAASERSHLDPHPAFWSEWYAGRYLDAGATATMPLVHFLTQGAAAGYDPNPLFHLRWYQQQYGDRMSDDVNPLVHYLTEGAAAGLDPSPLFSTTDARRRLGVLAEDPLSAFLDAEREPSTGPRPPVVRSTPKTAMVADLRWEYLVRGLHHEPDTFVLYRIIGNDLPPRHRAGQALKNLRFILDHEPDLPGCEKRWVVNRIVDPTIEEQIIALLEEGGRGYLHIPFDLAEYGTVGWRFAELHPRGLTYRREMDTLNPNDQQRVLDHVYHDKNLYVMNNNGARNAALQEGRGRAKWVLPWDGNCFVTRDAWNELVHAVTTEPHLKYFIVPMARVLENEVLLQPGQAPEAQEEPQLLFRRDAAEAFHSDLRYGRRPKVELFYRLGIPGPWEEWPQLPWDIPRRERSPEAGQYGTAGWVARLFSGEQRLETDARGRWLRRIEAIREHIDRIDESLARRTFDDQALFFLDDEVLRDQRERYRAGEPGPVAVVTELVGRIERVLSHPTHSVQSMIDETTQGALAGYITGDRRYLARSAELVRAWFLNPDTRMNPQLRFAQVRRAHSAEGENPSGVIEAKDLYYLLDAVRLLEREEALQPLEGEGLRTWFRDYRGWLEDSPQGRGARASLNSHGTWYDVQLVAIDGFLGDLRGLLRTARRGHERVGQQFEPDGSQPEELAGTQTQHGCAYNLQGWLALASGLRHVGCDLWSFRTADGRGLAAASAWLLGKAGKPWEHPQRDPFDTDRYVALAHQVSTLARDVSALAFVDEDQRDPWRVTQVFASDDGIRPFWVLGG